MDFRVSAWGEYGMVGRWRSSIVFLKQHDELLL